MYVMYICILQDLEYWEVDELYLEQCCVQKYYQQRELLTWDHQVKKEEELEVFRPGRLGRLQKILWDLFEKPHTSLGARVRLISFFFFVNHLSKLLGSQCLLFWDSALTKIYSAIPQQDGVSFNSGYESHKSQQP